MTPDQINHYGGELYQALVTRKAPLLGRAEGITIETEAIAVQRGDNIVAHFQDMGSVSFKFI